jgi:sugar lactone lactonase YvrE
MTLQWTAVTSVPDLLGESPFWHPLERALYWVDIPAKQIKRLAHDGQAQSWEMPSEPGCIAPVAEGGLMIALRDGVYYATSWGGSLEAVARFNHDVATTRFNDGKADPEGRFWAGTIYEPKDARKAELYCIDLRSGEAVVRLKAQNATTSNGLAWSPDGRTMYWADTPTHAVYAWDWDAATNALRHHRVFHQFGVKPAGWKPGDPGYRGRPDGATVDAEGNYWCALYEGQRLAKLSPAGQLLGEIELPVLSPTMPCFGGDDLRTLYVTTAHDHVISARVDVPGLPVNFVRT